MAINKVVFGNNTLIDLTSDTIGADKLLKGFTAHDASGASIVGTYEGGSVDGYTINLFASSSELYGQSIVVSYEGQRVTTIQFSNAGTASIVVQEEGAYNFAVSYGGLTYYCDVNVVSAVRTYNETIYYYPNGSTITPVNDVQIWISCADVRDKSYTTLAEVFADSELLATLMSSENAVNYLVRSKQFIKSEALVPTMTSATTPEGEVTASEYFSGEYPYQAFDGVSSKAWTIGSPTKVGWIDYQFVSDKVVSSFTMQNRDQNTSYICAPKTFTFEGSDDGITYSVLGSYTNTNNTRAYIGTYNLSTKGAYKHYRVNISDSCQSEGGLSIGELQFYSETGIIENQTAMSYIGASDYASDTLLSDTDWCEAIQNSEYFELVDNVKVPTMTSNIAPEGECFGSSILNAGYDYFKVFDNDASTYWHSATSAPQYVGYKFDSAVAINRIDVFCNSNGNVQRNPSASKLQASNDGVNWVDIADVGSVPLTQKTVTFSNDTEYLYYRYYISATVGYNYTITNSVQLYGRVNGGVQTWLRKAGITDKLYTTLAEVLSDTTTLEELIKNKDAVDYLVTCKGWAEQICADQNAMTYIGQNNYCANTLLADETWRTAICNSTYFESVLNVKVPKMTSDTTPEGECYSYYPDTRPQYAPYKAFDNDSTTWNAFANHTPINEVGFGYGFTKPVRLVAFSLSVPSFAVGRVLEVSIKGSNDKSVWTKLATYNNPSTADDLRHLIDVPLSEYQYFAFFVEALASGYTTGNVDFNIVQFYGREDIPEPTPPQPVQRQTNYYPFSSQTLIGGSNLAYGGVSFSSFKLSGRDLEEIQEIKIKGRLYISRGSTQMKKCRMDYTIAGEKDGKWCFWNGTSWDITDVNITERYGNGFYDARGWVNVKEISSNVATVKSELIDLTIPISTIVASAKSNGINLEFANTFLNTAYWYGNFVEILGDSCFSLGIFAGRFANTTNAFVYYGFSVDQVNTTSDDLDTVSELANNSPQVEIEWK